jgi:hypothetical protein
MLYLKFYLRSGYFHENIHEDFQNLGFDWEIDGKQMFFVRKLGAI